MVRSDAAVRPGAPTEIRGAAVWARGAVAYGHLATLALPVLVNGAVGIVVAPRQRVVRALRFTITDGKISEIEVIGDQARLDQLDVSTLD